MEANSVFRKNLEPDGPSRPVGRWSVSGFVDLLSERRFLLCSFRSPALNQLANGVVDFRLSSAAALAPEAFLPVVDVSHRESRIELLCAHGAPFDAAASGEEDLRRAAGTVLDVLATLETHGVDCAGLHPDAVVRDGDGGIRLLPTVIALPLAIVRELEGEGTDLPDDDAARHAVHIEQFSLMARALAAESPASGFSAALADCADAIDAGALDSLDAVSRRLFGRGPATGAAETPARDTPPAGLPDLEGARVIEVAGSPGSGKSRMLGEIAAAFRASGRDVCTIDVWSVTGRPRRRTRGAAHEQPWQCPVWVVDDIGDQRVIHSQLLAHVSQRADGDRVLVYAVDADAASGRLEPFLQSLRAHAGGEAVTLSPPAATRPGALATALDSLGGSAAGGDPAALAGALLERLEPPERQMLELAAVAGIPLPGDVVMSVLSGAETTAHRILYRLVSLGLVCVGIRRRVPGGSLGVMVSVPNASVRRGVSACLPADRLRNLHRTVARLADTHGGFPAMVVYEHLVRGGEPQAAAAHAVTFIRETGRDERAPFLDELIARFTDEESAGSLAYGDRLTAFKELGSDLLAVGRRADAEQLLLRARDIDADYEDIRVNAALYADVMRLLADTWGARGNYTQALELLTDTREFLSPHLSLAGQAQLMNEIGWVQYRLGDYESSVDACKLSLTTLNPNDRPDVVAQALNLMGVIHFNTSRYDEAIGYYEQSAFLREKLEAPDALAGSYNNLALAYQSKGEYDKALSYYDKSFEIKREVNNEAGLAAGFLNKALLYLEIHSFDDAEKMCRESLEISTNLGLEQLTAEIHNTLGDVEDKRGHFDEAESCYRRAIDIASSLETINEEMGARRRLARLYLTLDRLEEAREQIETAHRLGAQIGSKYEAAQIASTMGDLCVAEGRHNAAIEHYEKAASAYATLSRYRFAATALANIGLAHTESGNTLEAKHYLDRALDLIKSEIGHEVPDEIVTLQQTLRERPVRTSLESTESQRLLYAFYELSSLAEFAEDKTSFLKRAIATFQELTGAHSCTLALIAPEGSFLSVRENGEQEPLVDPGLRALLQRSLQLGALLHSRSPEAADVAAELGEDRGAGLICVPMKSMGRNLGCALLQVSPAALPPSKEEINFMTSVGRHIAGDLRLTFHLEEHATKEKTLETEFESLKAQVVDRYQFANLIGKDESMKKVFRTIDKVKDMDTGILIIGESGSGKTELARTIHYNSPRHKRPFQEIHCAEIPEELLESELFGHEKGAFTGSVKRKLGRCEVADGGTVFLDDVNVVPAKIQAKLLHYLESKSFMRLGGTQKITTDVRIIAASNEDLETLVKQGRFREDLYYRLKVIQLELPPLRERREDMFAIAQNYLKRRCAEQGKPLKTLSPETIKLFQRYPWPGNVRELQNVLEQIVLLSDEDIVEPASLPEDFLKRATGSTRHGRETIQALARQIVDMEAYSETNPLMPQLEALLAHEMVQHIDSKTKAARMLGITKPTLYNRLRGYDKLG